MWALSIINLRTPEPFCLPAAWEPWDTAWAQLSEPRWEIRISGDHVAGDGCFRMNMNELATATRNNMALVEVIINNRCGYGASVADPLL